MVEVVKQQVIREFMQAENKQRNRQTQLESEHTSTETDRPTGRHEDRQIGIIQAEKVDRQPDRQIIY